MLLEFGDLYLEKTDFENLGSVQSLMGYLTSMYKAKINEVGRMTPSHKETVPFDFLQERMELVDEVPYASTGLGRRKFYQKEKELAEKYRK